MYDSVVRRRYDCIRRKATPNGPSELPIAAVQRIRLTRWYDATRAPLVSEVNRPMKFDIQGKEGIASPTPAQISRAIKSLRSYGPSSYASLTDDAGNYVQVAGGGVSCMVEHFEIDGERRRRAFHDKPSPVRPDGTILVFGAGNIPMQSDEWFMSD